MVVKRGRKGLGAGEASIADAASHRSMQSSPAAGLKQYVGVDRTARGTLHREEVGTTALQLIIRYRLWL